MALDPNGPLTQYRTQIDQNTLDIADRPTTDQVLGVFVPAFYGGIGADGPVPEVDIDANWTTITAWDQALLANPRGVQQNFSSNGLQFDQVGIYNFYVKCSLSFAESNGSREISFRIFNQSQGAATGTEFDFFVGRNQGGVNASFQTMGELQQSEVGDLAVLQVRSALSTFTTVNNVGSVFQAFNIGELQGT